MALENRPLMLPEEVSSIGVRERTRYTESISRRSTYAIASDIAFYLFEIQ